MGKTILPKDQVYWYTLKKPSLQQKLTTDIQVDVAIIGGGAAGLAAAHSFRAQGLSVALLEKEFCGAGASGKSSGFISPDSELEAENFISHWGLSGAQKLWDFSLSGCAALERTILDYGIECDYQKQDTLFIATNNWGAQEVTREHKARLKLDYESHLYAQQELPHIIQSSYYKNAVRDSSTFGIIAYLYCQGLKDVLANLGVQIYENTPALSIDNHTIATPHATINAEYIIVAVDRFLPEFNYNTLDIYHAQTFLMASKPLSDDQVLNIFPEKKLMITDTELVFNYFRIVDTNRLLLGGGSITSTYSKEANHHASHVYHKLMRYIDAVFPHIRLEFEYMWPGLIGITKDLLPLAEPDPKYPHIYYIAGATGLAWATALGNYSAQRLLNNRTDMDAYFSSSRNFGVNHALQHIIGTPASFALGNFINKYLK